MKCSSSASTSGQRLNDLKCKLDAGHKGKHDSKIGLVWEDCNKFPVKVNYFIVEGKSGRGFGLVGVTRAYLLTEYITGSGRKFFKKDYQISER